MQRAPMQPVLCAVPVGRMCLSSSISYAFYLPVRLCDLIRTYLSPVYVYDRRSDRPSIFLISLLLTSKTPTVSILPLTFLSHVTNSLSRVLPVLAIFEPGLRTAQC